MRLRKNHLFQIGTLGCVVQSKSVIVAHVTESLVALLLTIYEFFEVKAGGFPAVVHRSDFGEALLDGPIDIVFTFIVRPEYLPSPPSIFSLGTVIYMVIWVCPQEGLLDQLPDFVVVPLVVRAKMYHPIAVNLPRIEGQ